MQQTTTKNKKNIVEQITNAIISLDAKQQNELIEEVNRRLRLNRIQNLENSINITKEEIVAETKATRQQYTENKNEKSIEELYESMEVQEWMDFIRGRN